LQSQGQPNPDEDSIEEEEAVAGRTFAKLWRARCGKHLADSIRRATVVARSKGAEGAATNFHNNQIYALCRCATREDFRKELKNFRKNFPYAAKLINQLEHEQWAQYAMLEAGISTFGHITSNLVEGFNGVVVKERKMEPLLMLDAILLKMCGYYQDHYNEALKWQARGDVITPWAEEARQHEKKLVQDNGYQIRKGGGKESFIVEDRSSVKKVRHHVCTDPKNPRCKSCTYVLSHVFFPPQNVPHNRQPSMIHSISPGNLLVSSVDAGT
tara:strand:- start:240 stop:1049 length:810 start_codon:yes stop_codon:yes gene_type:complete